MMKIEPIGRQFSSASSFRERDVNTPTVIQGGALRTWKYNSPAAEVVLGSEGRPFDADIELWSGPGNVPVKIRAYSEDGLRRPFSTQLLTRRGQHTVAIRNVGQLELPMTGAVVAANITRPSELCLSSSATVQGGSLRTYPFDPSVDSVQVLLQSDGRPLNARIEVLQGPNNDRMTVELYSEDGYNRPFFCTLETPGAGNVVRVLNKAPMEFPMLASVVPYAIGGSSTNDDDGAYYADGLASVESQDGWGAAGPSGGSAEYGAAARAARRAAASRQ